MVDITAKGYENAMFFNSHNYKVNSCFVVGLNTKYEDTMVQWYSIQIFIKNVVISFKYLISMI